MKKILTLIALLFIVPSAVSAQDGGNWNFGGNIGMSFGDYTNINVSPQVGYRFGKYFGLGAGLSYNYYKYDDYDTSLSYLGLNLNAKVYPVKFIFLFAQPEMLHRWGRVGEIKTKEETFAALLMGGGLSLPVSSSGNIVISVYYDVLQETSTPYGNNIGYSIGYSFNF